MQKNEDFGLSHPTQWSEDQIKGADQNHWPIRRRCPAKKNKKCY